jgi:flagellar biosynthesis component FlhA
MYIIKNMLNDLLDIIFASNLNLAITAVILLVLGYAAVKRLFRIVFLGLTIFSIYCSILLLNNEPLPTTEEITEQLTPDKETQKVIKDAFEDAEKEIKKRYEDLND